MFPYSLRREWRKRYFILKGNTLYFAKSPSDEPHGNIDLKDCLTVESAEDKTGKSNCFEVATAESTFYMRVHLARLVATPLFRAFLSWRTCQLARSWDGQTKDAEAIGRAAAQRC